VGIDEHQVIDGSILIAVVEEIFIRRRRITFDTVVGPR
jgi:hypothetical protein